MNDVEFNSGEVSVGNWFVTLLVSMIPVVGWVLLFVWAFGNNTEKSKSNWAKAMLIWAGIMAAFYFMLFMLLWVSAVANGSGAGV